MRIGWFLSFPHNTFFPTMVLSIPKKKKYQTKNHYFNIIVGSINYSAWTFIESGKPINLI
jgi:hypothetical protein